MSRIVPALVLAAGLLACGRRGPSDAPEQAVDLRPLLAAARDAQRAAALDPGQPLGPGKTLERSHSMWPMFTFLMGEVHLQRKGYGQARSAYRSLVEWAVADSKRDGWGGSCVATVALWRWLRTLELESSPPHEEGARLLELADQLRKTRFYSRLFTDPILSNTPRLEEDILRRLALLARSIGKEDDALRLFLDYLSIASTAELGPAENQLKERLVAVRLASQDRLTLFRGKRLASLGMNEDAFTLLSEAGNSKDPQVRAEAGLYLARVGRIRGRGRKETAELLSSVIEDATHPEVLRQALLDRARVLNREGRDRDVQQSIADFRRVAETLPRDHFTDDALYELARIYQDQGDLDQALACFSRLRSLPEPNDYANLAYFQPAMALYTRGRPEDVAQARALLAELQKQQPDGPLHLNVMFWLARTAAESGDEQQAGNWYRQLIQESPYSYYAIRARMHQRLGNAASREFWPDAESAGELRGAYQRSKVETIVAGTTSYHLRLRQALETGLYAASFAADRQLREAYPSKRLEELTPEELDAAGLVSPLAVWLALRQDAMAANDASPSAVNRLQIAGAVGQVGGDWPLAMNLVMAVTAAHDAREAAQRDQRYLATAFPVVFGEAIRKSSAAYNIRQELLYSIIRHESLFYPAALSERGALGLFQITPATFRGLPNQWKLPALSGAGSREAFLLDPGRSIDVGAHLFRDEFLKHQQGNLMLAVMEQNAGIQAVREWVAEWKSLGRNEDLEYMIETARFRETRVFARDVLATAAIAEACGILKGGGTPGSGDSHGR